MDGTVHQKRVDRFKVFTVVTAAFEEWTLATPPPLSLFQKCHIEDVEGEKNKTSKIVKKNKFHLWRRRTPGSHCSTKAGHEICGTKLTTLRLLRSEKKKRGYHGRGPHDDDDARRWNMRLLAYCSARYEEKCKKRIEKNAGRDIKEKKNNPTRPFSSSDGLIRRRWLQWAAVPWKEERTNQYTHTELKARRRSTLKGAMVCVCAPDSAGVENQISDQIHLGRI